MTRIPWPQLFMRMAHLVSERSPDAETRHGAVLVDECNCILGVGFNGFVRGANDSTLPRFRPDKYPHMVHAESNCLMNARLSGGQTNLTMYVTGFPCDTCANLMAQAGVKCVVYGSVMSGSVSSSAQRETINRLTGIVAFTNFSDVMHEIGQQ